MSTKKYHLEDGFKRNENFTSLMLLFTIFDKHSF